MDSRKPFTQWADTITTRLRHWLDPLDRLLVWLCALCLFAFTGAQLATVLTRTLEITWVVGGELSTIAFIWGTFLGASLGVRRDAHLKLSAGEDSLRGAPRVAFMMIGRIGIVVAGLVMLATGIGLVQLGAGSMMPFLGIPRAVYYAALPVGGLLIALFGIEQLMRVRAESTSTAVAGIGAAESEAAPASRSAIDTPLPPDDDDLRISLGDGTEDGSKS